MKPSGTAHPRLARAPRPSALLLLLLCTLACAIPAAARQLVIQNFDDQIMVNRDGTTDVTESIAVQFTGSWNGIYRKIPVEYNTDEGLNYTLMLSVSGITDDAGQNLRFTQKRSGRNLVLQIWVPDAANNTRTVVIRYHVLNAIRFFPDHDELYWSVTGNEWEMPIEAASARIQLPEGASGIRATAFTGAYGSRAEDATVSTNDNEISVHTTHALAYREGLTVVAGFDKGIVRQPTVGAKILMFLRSNWPFAIPIAVFLLMLWLWWTRGRDPRHGAVVVQYDPPDNLSPGECGTLVDNEAGMRDITATLVDLAVKGYLTIEQTDDSQMLGLLHKHSYVFHLKKQPPEWSKARPYEQEMLAAVFDGGGSADVPLAGLQNHFYTHLPSIRDRIFDALMSDGYYLHRPDTVRQAYIGMGLLIGFLIVAFSGWLSGFTGVAPFTWVLAGIAVGAVICIFGWFMPARTIAGWRALEKVIGFEQFLGRVQKDQIERLEKSPGLFEKYLPYAMALRVEKRWVQAFSGIALQPPQWFQGAYIGAFEPYLLVNALSMMSAQTGAAMISAPRSSSGMSGFGGGGMSGGGFGGGGGGGF
ncbi:MAG TPA: DUF2207 domain-containing protein [Candidatus Acidoferrales bacterium]|nr:DUF2207 domain-containing protein [Candidatus Acidoferrales bacterium]